MEYIRITTIRDPLFEGMYKLMGSSFRPEEVLAFDLWEEPLQDKGIHVYVAVHEGEVVGATEYRYYDDLRTAVTDFTLIGRPGLAIGRFLAANRKADLDRMAAETRTSPLGMFAKIYDPYAVDYPFGGVGPMNP